MLSKNILDVYDDNSMSLMAVIERDYDVPDYVKKASIELGESGRSSKKTFASPELGNKFAMDTRADIWLSKAYLSKSASNISGYLVPVIERRLNENAQLMQYDIQLVKRASQKPVEIKYEVPLEKFALYIPKEKLASGFSDKYKNYFYRDEHFCLYPLDTPANIKKANMNFPKGLDNELEVFRPIIAQKIASLIPSNERSTKINNYLPMSKSAALMEIEQRIRFFPEQKIKYSSLREKLNDKEFDKVKFATDLEIIDKEAGAEKYYDSAYQKPISFLRNIYDDMAVSDRKTKVAYKNKEYSMELFNHKKDGLVQLFPDIKDCFEVEKMASYLNEMEDIASDYIIKLINNR